MKIHGNGPTGLLAATSDESLRLARVYKLAEELANKPGTVTEAKDIIVETFSRIADQDIIKHKSNAMQKIYELAVEAFIRKNPVAKNALKAAFVTEMANLGKTASDVSNKYELYSAIFDQMFDQIEIEALNLAPQTIPYILFSAPLLRFMMPRLVANDVFTVMPMKGPAVAMYFLKFYQGGQGLPYPFASYLQLNNNRLSNNTGLGGYGTNPGGNFSLTSAGVSVPANSQDTLSFNLLTALQNANLVPTSVTQADIAPGSVAVTAVVVNTGSATAPNYVTVNVNARANEQGAIYGTGINGSVQVVVSGRVYFMNGNAELQITATGGTIADVQMSARITYEYRSPARQVQLQFERFEITENRIEETLIASPEFLYDSKVLFDIDIQAEIVSILGTLMAVNTDSFLLAKLYNTAAAAGSPSVSVSVTPPSNFLLGQTKWWYEGAFVPAIFQLEAALRQNTPSLDVEPYLIMNPVDASYIRSVDKFSADLKDKDTDVSFSRRISGTLDKVLKILVTPLLPQGADIMVLKATNPLFATAVYAPYVTLFMPYPANTIGPALTGVHRFGTVVPLPSSIGLFNVTNQPTFPGYIDQ